MTTDNLEAIRRGDYCEVYNNGSKTTLVAFGGLGHQIGQPVFEFRKILKPLEANLVFFKDSSRSWYHKPIPEFGDDIHGKATRINEILDSLPQGPRRFIGSSAGGFAALIFSRLVSNVADCLLFGPQTFLDQRSCNIMNDKRWPRLVKMIPISDFMNVSSIAKLNQARTRIIVGSSCSEDMRHALYAASKLPIELHVLSRAGHNPARELKSAGVLRDVLEEFVSGKEISDRKPLKIANRIASLQKI